MSSLPERVRLPYKQGSLKRRIRWDIVDPMLAREFERGEILLLARRLGISKAALRTRKRQLDKEAKRG